MERKELTADTEAEVPEGVSREGPRWTEYLKVSENCDCDAV